MKGKGRNMAKRTAPEPKVLRISLQPPDMLVPDSEPLLQRALEVGCNDEPFLYWRGRRGHCP